MEEGISGYILGRLGMDRADIRTYSPLVLAYIGDAVFDLIIRSAAVGKGNAHVSDLHRRTSRIVSAHAQAVMARALEDVLTGEEKSVFRRGRNASPRTMAKNATVSDYRHATGFEALLGYLYLEDRMDRVMELVCLGLERTHAVI